MNRNMTNELIELVKIATRASIASYIDANMNAYDDDDDVDTVTIATSYERVLSHTFMMIACDDAIDNDALLRVATRIMNVARDRSRRLMSTDSPYVFVDENEYVIVELMNELDALKIA